MSPTDALSFFDSLLRVEAYPEHHREEERALVEEARAFLSGRQEELRAAASQAVDPEALLEEAYALATEGDRGWKANSWAERCLKIANAASLLPEELAASSAEWLQEWAEIVTSNPGAFVAAHGLATRRMELEFPEAIPLQLGHSLLLALYEAPELARLDRRAANEPLPEGLLERTLARLPADLLLEAEQALEEAMGWRGRLLQMRRSALEAASKIAERAQVSFEELFTKEGELPLMMMAASTVSPLEEEHLLLRRLPEGELILSRRAASLYVDWYGSGEPELSEGDAGPLPFEAIEEGRRWTLPLRSSAIHRTFRLGPTRIEIELPEV